VHPGDGKTFLDKTFLDIAHQWMQLTARGTEHPVSWRTLHALTRTVLTAEQCHAQESNLAWSFDRNHLYGNQLPTNFNDVPATRGGNTSTVPLNTDQHLMVWMRVSAHATVRKLYAVISTDIPAGVTLALPLISLCQAAVGWVLMRAHHVWLSGFASPNQCTARLASLGS